MNKPAARNADELILEGIVTSTNEDGTTNVSPMGPVADREITRLRLRPFSTSTTYQNLKRLGKGVFHVTDDVDLLVRSALGMPCDVELLPAVEFDVEYLASACRWYAFEVTSLDDSEERVEIECAVVKRGHVRDFLGWNRAMHAVLEATILATRVHMLPAEHIAEELNRFQTTIDKTASEAERAAFRLVLSYVENHEQSE